LSGWSELYFSNAAKRQLKIARQHQIPPSIIQKKKKKTTTPPPKKNKKKKKKTIDGGERMNHGMQFSNFIFILF